MDDYLDEIGRTIESQTPKSDLWAEAKIRALDYSTVEEAGNVGRSHWGRFARPSQALGLAVVSGLIVAGCVVAAVFRPTDGGNPGVSSGGGSHIVGGSHRIATPLGRMPIGRRAQVVSLGDLMAAMPRSVYILTSRHTSPQEIGMVWLDKAGGDAALYYPKRAILVLLLRDNRLRDTTARSKSTATVLGRPALVVPESTTGGHKRPSRVIVSLHRRLIEVVAYLPAGKLVEVASTLSPARRP